MKTIFCVEDDINIRELTAYALGSSGFSVLGYERAEGFFAQLKNQKPDLILLDIMLPDTDGMEILKRLKNNASTREIPVIMLTSKSTEYDKVLALDMGADDYITKPFGVLELVSRVNAVLRRFNFPTKISCRGMDIDYLARTVTIGGDHILLTNKEFELLYYLVQNAGIVLSRDKILNNVWGYDFEGETRTVDVHIGTLRQKLGQLGSVIETVRSVGYKI